MEEYKEIVEWYKSTLIFKLSQIGYALNCNLLFSDRLELLDMNKSFELLQYLKDGDKVFIDLYALKFIEKLYIIMNHIKSLNIKINFYLQFEPFVPPEIIHLLLPFSYHIYCNNNNFSHPNVHYMPIGIRDCGITIRPGHENFFHSYLFNQGLKDINKQYLCLLGGFGNTHPDRLKSHNLLKDKGFIYDISNNTYTFNMTSKWGQIPVIKYYDFLHHSHYVISPSGLGVDTHRFFEALYLKTIPIVKKTNSCFDKVYDNFPCLVINDWSDINEDLLNSNLSHLNTKINTFFDTYPNFFFNISILDSLLLSF